MGVVIDMDHSLFVKSEQLLFHLTNLSNRYVRNDGVLVNTLLLIQRMCAPNTLDLFLSKDENSARAAWLKLPPDAHLWGFTSRERPQNLATLMLHTYGEDNPINTATFGNMANPSDVIMQREAILTGHMRADNKRVTELKSVMKSIVPKGKLPIDNRNFSKTVLDAARNSGLNTPMKKGNASTRPTPPTTASPVKRGRGALSALTGVSSPDSRSQSPDKDLLSMTDQERAEIAKTVGNADVIQRSEYFAGDAGKYLEGTACERDYYTRLRESYLGQ